MEQTQEVKEKEIKEYDGAMLLSWSYFQELNIAIWKDMQEQKERRMGA